MKIYSVTSADNHCRKQKLSYPKKQPAFKSMGFTFASYKDCFGITRETQNTTGRRDDISLKEFADVVKMRFKDFDRVNIMPMNVSDGTEAYLMANAIIRNEGWETFEKKYSPIKASDVMPNVINNYARNGLLHLYNNEINEFDGIGIQVLEEVSENDYKDKIIRQLYNPDKLYKLSKEYRKHFDFQVEDLQARIQDLKDEGNSVVVIRNCLKQSFGDTLSSLIIIKLMNIMRGASLLITGDYDRKSKLIEQTLKDYFYEIRHNIWGLKEYGKFRNYLTKMHA